MAILWPEKHVRRKSPILLLTRSRNSSGFFLFSPSIRWSPKSCNKSPHHSTTTDQVFFRSVNSLPVHCPGRVWCYPEMGPELLQGGFWHGTGFRRWVACSSPQAESRPGRHWEGLVWRRGYASGILQTDLLPSFAGTERVKRYHGPIWISRPARPACKISTVTQPCVCRTHVNSVHRLQNLPYCEPKPRNNL